MQPYDVNLWYFKITLFDPIAFMVWNIKGLRHWVATSLKLENQSLLQKLNSFRQFLFFFAQSRLNNKHLNRTENVWILIKWKVSISWKLILKIDRCFGLNFFMKSVSLFCSVSCHFSPSLNFSFKLLLFFSLRF